MFQLDSNRIYGARDSMGDIWRRTISAHAPRSFCQALKCVLRCHRHYGEHAINHSVRQRVMEEIAMRGDKDQARALPAHRLVEPLLVKPHLARPHRAGVALLRQTAARRVVPQARAGELHRITIRAARREHAAAGNDIPGRPFAAVGAAAPFDCCAVSHHALPIGKALASASARCASLSCTNGSSDSSSNGMRPSSAG